MVDRQPDADIVGSPDYVDPGRLDLGPDRDDMMVRRQSGKLGIGKGWPEQQ